MRLSDKHRWFLGFTAVFAVMTAFVFWGAWSLDFTFVMPDAPTVPSPDWFSEFWRRWCTEGKFHPTNALFLLGSQYFWQELFYAVADYCAALAVFYFLRGRGLGRLASYGAGLFLAFCGYWFTLFSAGHGSWFFWMTYGLFPFGLLDRAIAKGKPKNWLLLGATLGWASQWQTDLWLLFTTLTGCYFVYRCLRERRFPWKGMLLAALSLFVIGGAGFYSALATDLKNRNAAIAEGATLSKEVQEKVDEREKRWIFVTNWSMPTEETLEFFIPRVNGDTSCPMTLSLGARYGTGVRPYTGAIGRPIDARAGNYRQHSLYVGWVTCLLALIGCVMGLVGTKRIARADVLFFLCAAVVCWLCSMGRYCEPVYRVVFSLPFGDYLRAPVKWHHLTEFCLCVLAGFGIEALLGLVGRLGFLKGRAFLAPAIVGAFVFLGVVDLATHAKIFCSPVDLREAKRQNCNMQMTFLRRADFNNPQVAAMVQAKRIVPLAQPNSEMYLVGVLDPWKKNTDPFPPLSTTAWLSILSMIGTLGLAGYGAKRCWRNLP